MDARFDFSFIAWFIRSGRERGAPVVREHLVVRGVEERLVAAGPADAALEVVGDDELRHSAEEGKGADVRADPVRQALRPRRFGEGVGRRTEGGDEDLGDFNFARGRLMMGTVWPQ